MSSYLARVRMWLLDFDGYGGRGEDIWNILGPVELLPVSHELRAIFCITVGTFSMLLTIFPFTIIYITIRKC